MVLLSQEGRLKPWEKQVNSSELSSVDDEFSSSSLEACSTLCFPSDPYNTICLHISGHEHTYSSKDSTYTSEGRLCIDTESSEDSSSKDSTYTNFF